MNLQQLRERARSLSGIRQPAIKSDTDVNALINESYLELAGVDDWPWTYREETVAVDAGQSEVEIPTPMRTIEGVLFDGLRLAQTTLAEVDIARIEDEGDPYAYARVDNQHLLLVPAPKSAGTVRLRGYRQVVPLADDVDEPIFDPEFHGALAYAAAARMLIEEADDSGRSNAYGQEVQGTLIGMRQRYLRSHESTSFQIGGRRQYRRRWRL